LGASASSRDRVVVCREPGREPATALHLSKAALETTWKRGQRDLAAARKMKRKEGWKRAVM
jgi:hypothetical protein